MKQNNKAFIFVISAPSGAGKSTIIDKFLNENNFLKKPISYTTRNIRGDEKDGIDYNFITKNKFNELKNTGDFLEWATVYDNLYASSFSVIHNSLNNNISLIKDIDVQGARNIKNKLKEQAILVFIQPPSIEELEKRLLLRNTDTKDVIKIRLEKAKNEIKESYFYDHVIINDKVSNAVKELKNIIKKYLPNK